MDFSNDPAFIAAVAKATAERLAASIEFKQQAALSMSTNLLQTPGFRESITKHTAERLLERVTSSLEHDIRVEAKREVARIIARQLGAKVAKLANQMAEKLAWADKETE